MKCYIVISKDNKTYGLLTVRSSFCSSHIISYENGSPNLSCSSIEYFTITNGLHYGYRIVCGIDKAKIKGNNFKYLALLYGSSMKEVSYG